MKKPLPIGFDNFKDVIDGGYYYVDKTPFIKELLDTKGKVNLFTRPRRFGKTLTASMLQYFFEDTGSEGQNLANQKLFAGMKIMEAGDAYTRHMTGYPVISLSLKSGKQPDFQMSLESIQDEIIKEFNRHNDIKESGKLLANERERFEEIQNGTASQLQYAKSLEFLSSCLRKAYGSKVIILIDEYDVPLEHAYFEGFYDQMVGFIRSLFESALKTNPSLEFAVITGCLRITKESIFTGLNNLEIISILSESYGEYFGFVQSEVDSLLAYYEIEFARETIKKWYDGYRFGNAEVYNPWSVIKYVKALCVNPEAFPSPYWANTSSNSIVRNLVERADLSVKGEIEELLVDGMIEKPVHEDITYADIFQSDDNLWNFLFFTGYLKKVSSRMEGENQYITMAIPNTEVCYIYNHTILNWFRNEIKIKDLSALYHAIMEGDAPVVQSQLSQLLMESISFMDSKEAFYHGFLLGVLGNMRDYLVKSNRESGEGRYDILIRSLDVTVPAVIFELKVSDTFKGLEKACDDALSQIQKKKYDAWLPEEGYGQAFHYGIAFYKKQCRVKVVEKKLK